jgi:hypothetical protein
MDRYYEPEDLRPTLAILPPGSDALDRDDAIRLLAEVEALDLGFGRFVTTVSWHSSMKSRE